MDRATEKRLAARAVDLGNAGDGGALPELVGLLDAPAAEGRLLAGSAIGKLAGLADPAGAHARQVKTQVTGVLFSAVLQHDLIQTR